MCLWASYITSLNLSLQVKRSIRILIKLLQDSNETSKKISEYGWDIISVMPYNQCIFHTPLSSPIISTSVLVQKLLSFFWEGLWSKCTSSAVFFLNSLKQCWSKEIQCKPHVHFIFQSILAMPRDLQDLSFLTREWTLRPWQWMDKVWTTGPPGISYVSI